MPSILETVGPRSDSAPLTYTLAETGTVDVMSIFASFDGSAAGGSFRPVVTVRSQSGAILARGFPPDSVAAGDSADVTFAPFLRGGGGGSAAAGIQFDVTPQIGGFLDITTNSGAISVYDSSSSGINLFSDDGAGGGGQIDISTEDGNLVMRNRIISARVTNSFEVRGTGSSPRFRVFDDGATSVRLGTGASLTVVGSAGTAILRVTDDGTYHILTGAAWVADL
jgi:hypothetical protein